MCSSATVRSTKSGKVVARAARARFISYEASARSKRRRQCDASCTGVGSNGRTRILGANHAEMNHSVRVACLITHFDGSCVVVDKFLIHLPDGHCAPTR